MAEAVPGELRYKAFLSYSHKDAAVAAKLHRRLETYRLPRRLVGKEGARGPVPERLWPIFRDREELPAATDLSETVRAALAESGSLIVLCSPHAAASLWVAEEIETFRRLYPERPVLAAIIDGEPGQCFPAALRAFGQDGTWHEPLATDLRPQGDGPQLGLLKLVAGITGVGLDALVQRDAQRKVRRVTAVTVTALLALLLMTGLTVFALDSRAEAERQRAEAEGLIEFMLTDLRQELRGVGRLDVMAGVNFRALSYYTRDIRSNSPSGQAMRARVIHAIGEDHLIRNDLNAALNQFRRAHALTSALISREPSLPEVIFAHAQSEYWIGRVNELREEWPAARSQYERYAENAARLIELEPNNPDYLMEMGYGAMNRGVIELNSSGNAASAEAFFVTGAQWFERAARIRPGSLVALRELANAYSSIAGTFYARERWTEALGAYQKQHQISIRAFEANPSDLESNFRLAISERAVALLSIRSGLPRNERMLRQAHERMARLVMLEPTNTEWLILKAKIECDVINGFPLAGLRVDRARASVLSAISRLRAQENPRFREIECLASS